MKKLDETSKAYRDFGTDLLRIILMAMIVLHHMIVHGFGLSGLQNGQMMGGERLFLANSFVVVAVNSFFFISGFWKIKANWKKLIALFLETALYILAINLVFIVTGIEKLSVAFIFKIAKEMLMCLNQYWFMAAYFIVYLLAPYINKLTDQLDETERINFFILLMVVNTLFGFLFGIGGLGEGHTAIQGIYLYILGRLCAEENEKIRKIISRKYLLLIYLIACIANGVLVCIFNMIGEYKRAWKLFSYNNPLIVVAACVLSLLFIGMKMKSHMLKRLIPDFAKHVLAIYLLTDYEPMRKFIFWPVVVVSKYSNSIILIVAIIVLYVAVVSIVCILIDCLMSKVYNAILVKK